MKISMIATVALLSLVALASSAPLRSYYQEKDAQQQHDYKYYDQLKDALEQSNGNFTNTMH